MINAPTYSLPAGTIIDKRYEIVRYISSGGFGITYEAIDKRFNSKVAVKELYLRDICNRDSNTDSISVNDTNISTFGSHKRKFLKEAHRLHKLSHPNIVKVSDVIDANGTAYYVMDYIEGNPLSKERTPMDEAAVMAILNQLLDAIEYIHSNKLLHLDIKPSNIMIDNNGKAILIDFGASKIIETTDFDSISTTTALCYTPGYSPLEQMSASSASDLGTHSDIYALGATLFKLLSGNTPPLPNDILKNSGKIPSLNNISDNLRKAIEKSMVVLHTNRLSTVAQLRQILNKPIIDKNIWTQFFIWLKSHKPIFSNNPKRALSIIPIIAIVGLGIWGIASLLSDEEDSNIAKIHTTTQEDSIKQVSTYRQGQPKSTEPKYYRDLTADEKNDVAYMKKNDKWTKSSLKSKKFISAFDDLANVNISNLKRTFSGFQDKHLNLYIKAIISRYPDARPEQKEKFKEIVSKSTIDLKEAVLAIARSDNENEGSNAEVKTNSKGDAKVNNKTTNKGKTEEVIVID